MLHRRLCTPPGPGGGTGGLSDLGPGAGPLCITPQGELRRRHPIRLLDEMYRALYPDALVARPELATHRLGDGKLTPARC